MRHALIAIALAVPAVAHATPFEPATIPQTAEAAGHLDADALRASQLFIALGGQGAIDKALDDMPPDLKPFVAPLVKSMRGVSFWHADDHGAVYVETRDARGLGAMLAKAPVKPGAAVDGMPTYTADESSRPAGQRHHHGPNDKGYLGAYADTLVIADTYETLAISLRTLAGKAPNVVGSRTLAATPRSGVFVFVTVGDGLLDDLSKSSPSKLVQLGAKSIVIDASETAGVVTANARAELASADALAKAKSILEGMRALASMSNEPGAKQLLDGLTVSTNGLNLAVTGKWKVADLKTVIENHHK